MNLLVVSNYYPPYEIGGYELGCRDIVESLRRTGHQVTVVTSRHGVSAEQPDVNGVIRELSVNREVRLSPWRNVANKLSDLSAFRRILKARRPDLVYFFNLSGLTLQIVALTGKLGFARAFFISDGSFVAWRTGAFLHKWIAGSNEVSRPGFLQRVFTGTRLLLGTSILEGMPCHFASNFLADLARLSGIRPAHDQSAVIHWGIDSDAFNAGASTSRWPPERFLVVGQIIPQKGVHTVIEAFRILLTEGGDRSLHLTIVGGSSHATYEAEMRDLVRLCMLGGNICFVGKRPRNELPEIYAAHDALLFPSEWDEPFAITPLEAMASGLPVIGTLTGGSGELFRDGITALTFKTGDAVSCADAIRKLRASERLFYRLAEGGATMVRSDFTLSTMMRKIERALLSLVREPAPG